MDKLKKLWMALALPALLAACNNTADTETTQAMDEYRTYVTEFESDSLTEDELTAMEQAATDSPNWATEEGNLLAEYREKRQVIETTYDDLPAAQQAEADELEQRYNRALEQRKQQYKEVSHRYALRKQLLGLDVNTDGMGNISADDIGAAYIRFVEGVEQQAVNFDTRDWNLVEGWWSSLNSRYRTIEGELSNDVKRQVQQLQSRYQEVHSQAAAEGTSAEV